MAQQQQHESTTDVITTITPRIRLYCREHLPHAARADAVQDTILHLLEHALPAFDPTRGAKLTTYLKRCALNYIREEARKIRRQRRLSPAPLEDADPIGPDQSHDRQVEQLAEMIVSDPGTHLNSQFRAALLKAIVENPEAPRGAVANLLGVDVRKVWSTLYRVKEEITAVLNAKCA
jgi:DNA-directed RNA polymerase specialized sigma24 family protein